MRNLQNILPLAHAGSRYLLYCFEWKPRWYERLYFSSMAMLPGQAERRFSRYFEIEKIAGEDNLKGFPHGYAVYLMTRKKTS